MLGFFPVKSVGSGDEIGYGKRKLAEICNAAKGQTWKSIAYRQWKHFLNCHTSILRLHQQFHCKIYVWRWCDPKLIFVQVISI